MSDFLYIPFPKPLYDDIVLMSGGTLDPSELAVEQTLDIIERNLDDLSVEWFGSNLAKFVDRHLPWCTARISETANTRVTGGGSLMWKSVTVPEGAAVRMDYRGNSSFAKVVGGKIVDHDGEFTPSEWARKVANNTSRNAWRDIWFKRITDREWVLADQLRKK